MSQQEVRILTYNIHKGFNVGNRQFILHEMRDALQQADADVMLLQEIHGQHQMHQQRVSAWPEGPHSDFLAQDVWPHVAYGKNAVYQLGHHGNAILSKYPLVAWENINLSTLRWASRSLLHAVIQHPSSQQEMHMICIHLGLFGKERRRQFETLCERIEAHVPASAPLVVAGDFNDWSLQAEKRFASRLALHEAFQTLHKRHARTWPAWLPLLKVDRIYYRGMEATLCERPRQPHWTQLSDHAPLIASFAL